MVCLVCVGLWVEEALADVPATPPDHDVDPSVEVHQRREGDHRCGDEKRDLGHKKANPTGHSVGEH